MKKALKITLFSVLGLVVIAGILVWMEFGPLAKGAMSCEKLDEGMYYMEYAGDDGFDELMKRGGCAKCRLKKAKCQMSDLSDSRASRVFTLEARDFPLSDSVRFLSDSCKIPAE